jgi:hypothetical protein
VHPLNQCEFGDGRDPDYILRFWHRSDPILDADEAKAAIDGYFHQRNEQFRQKPRRAGRKIWGQERERSSFSDGNNCKDPQYCWASSHGGSRSS